MNAQNVSNTLLALAAGGIQPHPRLSSVLLQAVRQQSSRMNEQAVNNSMWSLATLQLETGGELSEHLQEAALQRAPHMNAQASVQHVVGAGVLPDMPQSASCDCARARAARARQHSRGQHTGKCLLIAVR